MDFPTRLKQLRLEHKLTQEQLGKKINVTKVSISGYENGTRTPDVETLQKIADVFDVSVDYLLGRTDEPTPKYKGETDIKKILEQQEKAHWDGRELTEEERRYLSRLIRVAIQRDEEAAEKKRN